MLGASRVPFNATYVPNVASATMLPAEKKMAALHALRKLLRIKWYTSFARVAAMRSTNLRSHVKYFTTRTPCSSSSMWRTRSSVCSSALLRAFATTDPNHACSGVSTASTSSPTSAAGPVYTNSSADGTMISGSALTKNTKNAKPYMTREPSELRRFVISPVVVSRKHERCSLSSLRYSTSCIAARTRVPVQLPVQKTWCTDRDWIEDANHMAAHSHSPRSSEVK